MAVSRVHVVVCRFFVFFKQKTAYEMRISDWSSDVCSSDLSFNHRSTAFGGVLGACHAIDIPFVFDVLDKRGMENLVGEVGLPERTLAEATRTAWATFASDRQSVV